MPTQKITSKDITRLLFLDGEKGSLACRVHGSLIAKPIPHLSPAYSVETSLRSRLRLNNLVAVRGRPGEGMVGPADYYGNWEKPELYSYTIDIEDGFPTLYQHEPLVSSRTLGRAIAADEITEVTATWISGTDVTKIQEKRREYPSRLTGESLFKNSGILEIEGMEKIELKQFNATAVDLTPFKARLVANNVPFQITSEFIPCADEWRAVSYHYEPGYAKRQVAQSAGLFLETHDFPQSITPLDPSSSGFVTLAKWSETQKGVIEIIGIRIPFGHTLIIEKGCIHGDTDLVGMFMMCMTSNHITMRSANTVFLKNAATKKNMELSLEAEPDFPKCIPVPQRIAARPFVIYREQEDFKDFNGKTAGMSFMFNPLSLGWWKMMMHDRHGRLSLLSAYITATTHTSHVSSARVSHHIGASESISPARIGFFASRDDEQKLKDVTEEAVEHRMV